ncbi:hypothetical protein DFQ26_006635 [Actinomortierella ambigua]|nr:hypothetical protein DFQ26_006635 [Actinomortierella ambigua]
MSQHRLNPFAGQNIGYFRLSVVGDSGVGKTSFARQFIETLPEIISHDWESIDPNTEEYMPTNDLVEKFSSTMMEIPWDNMDADEEVPARNLVFLDTPGYGSVVDAQTNFDLVSRYMTQTFEEKNAKISPFIEVSNGELMRSLVTGVGAHKFIDLCFYLIVHRLKPIDVEYMRVISEKCNVVPVICKVDTQSKQDVFDLKAQVLKTLKDAGVSIYTFRIDHDRLVAMAEAGEQGGPPFAVSNVRREVHPEDEGDRVPFTAAENELPLLRKLVLETQITNIRQFTVKKFINWRKKQEVQNHQQQQQQQQSSPYLAQTHMQAYQQQTSQQQAPMKHLQHQFQQQVIR